MTRMIVLGIESSCDDCCVALVKDGSKVLSSVIASQYATHSIFEGVVPELASRLHAESIVGVYRQALQDSGLDESAIDAVAVTAKPGLIGSLLVGLSFAKAYAFARNLPLIGVNHLQAHLYASQLSETLAYPHLGLLVSGGHTLIVRIDDFDRYEILGSTVDDAAGEAFDKVAKALGLGYPGGKIVDDLAQTGDPEAFHFPKPRIKNVDRFDFSFSGLKTAVVHQRAQFINPGKEDTIPNICASFQKTAVETLFGNLKLAVRKTGLQQIVVGGGVGANSELRNKLKNQKNWSVSFPPLSYCTDNAAMVGGLGFHLLQRGERSDWTLNAESRVIRLGNKP